MSTKTLSEAAEIIQNNMDHTLFSWSKQKGLAPIAVKHAEGVYLYDYDGNRIIDFSSGLMNVNIGHGNQRVTAAVVKQMQEVAYVTPSCVTKVRGELGKNWLKYVLAILTRPSLLYAEPHQSKMPSSWHVCIQVVIKLSPVINLIMELQ